MVNESKKYLVIGFEKNDCHRVRTNPKQNYTLSFKNQATAMSCHVLKTVVYTHFLISHTMFKWIQESTPH